MKLDEVAANKLLLDDENPRLPENMESTTPDALLKWMANQYNTLEVARSVAEHGYFDSEPMIAIKEGNRFKVVEGNRRLTALKLLLDDSLRHSIALDEPDKWDELASETEIEDRFPIHIAKNRQSVAPIIGYRHIAGIEPWDPWAKARFIAKQVEHEKQSFEDVARIVGEDESDVRESYRNYRIAVDAEKKLKVPADLVKKKFGIFTRAMNSVGLREHMGAPAPGDVRAGKPVLKRSKKKEVTEIFSWLFGDAKNEPVINESRQISELGQVVGSPEALKILRKGRDLEEALLASGGVRERLLKRLATAAKSLETAEKDIATFRDDSDVQKALQRCAQAITRLKKA